MGLEDGRRRREGGGGTATTTTATTTTTTSSRSGDFPACACDALHQVGKTLRQAANKSRNSLMSQNVLDLQATIDLDLFCLSPDRRSTRLSPIQQLKLLELLCSFFQEKCDEGRQRYSYFELIFCGREGETVLHEARIALLVRLVSLAVQYPCHSLLHDVALWLNKVGLAKPYAKQLVTTLVDHFCSPSLVDDAVSAEEPLYASLYSMGSEAPEMAAFLLVLPLREASRPPDGLVSVIGEWLCSYSKKLLPSLQRGELSKIFIAETFPNMIRLSTESAMDTNISAVPAIYSKFHTGLLHLLMVWAASGGAHSGGKLLSECLVVAIVEDIGSQAELDTTRQQMALDRVAQLLQCALASHCFSGSVEGVRKACEAFGLQRHPLFSFIFSQDN